MNMPTVPLSSLAGGSPFYGIIAGNIGWFEVNQLGDPSVSAWAAPAGMVPVTFVAGGQLFLANGATQVVPGAP
jgi:hypothetical protein